MQAAKQNKLKRGKKTSAASGSVTIAQDDYSSDSLCLALGGLKVFWKQIDDLRYSISFNKTYSFSPAEKRISQAVHRAAFAFPGSSSFSVAGQPADISLEPIRVGTAKLTPGKERSVLYLL